LTVWKQTYTPREVSTILSVSEDTVYNWIDDGTIPAEKIGGVWRIPIRLFHARFPDLDPPRKSLPK
jgi:excisionase family DNA binding protein